MDVMMPELDGFSAVREIRKNKNIPVIMLSARGEEYDRIHGFEVGVDDYVVKPFSPRELMMRIAAVLRRSGKEGEGESDVVDYGDLAIDFRGRFVYGSRQARRNVSKRIRPAFLSCKKRQRRAQPRKTHNRGVGL